MSHLEAKVLGRLLVAHQTLEVMPDEEHMAAFTGQALQDVPGVDSAHLYIGGVLLPSDDTRPDRAEITAACQRYTGAAANGTGGPLASGPFLLPLVTIRRNYGFLALTLSDAEAFAPYLDFLKNIAGAIATSLETRRHLAELTRANNELGALRRELEASLNNSGTIQRSVVAAMAEGVCFQSSTGEIIAVNPAAAKIHGCTAEQMMGRTSHLPPLPCITEDGVPFPGDLHPSMVTLRTGQPQDDVVMGLCKPDGSVTWISINSQPLLREGQNQPYAVVTTFRDISDQKRAEEELLKTTDELDRFFTIVPDLLSIATDEGVFLRLNPAWERTLGYARDEMIGRPLTDFLHPEDVEATLQARRTLLKHKGVIDLVNRYRCKDGTYRWFEWSATTAGGRIYAAARDITQRKQTEEELRDRTDELNRFFSIVPDLLSIASADGYFLRLNPAWEETLGYSREELMRSQFTDFVHPEDVAATRKAMTVLASRKELINFTNRVRRKDGSYRWFEWSATATNQQGYAAARDITERKQAEELLQLALQVGKIGTFEVDLTSGCGTCTPELKEILGYPAGFRRVRIRLLLLDPHAPRGCGPGAGGLRAHSRQSRGRRNRVPHRAPGRLHPLAALAGQGGTG